MDKEARRQVYDTVAPFYAWVRAPLARRDTTMELVLSAFPQDIDHLLDLGTGPGVYAIEFARRRPDCRVTAVDFSSSFVRIAQERAKKAGVGNVEVLQGDAEDLPFEDATFAGVICGGVLSVVSDRERAVRQVHRVLRPGGTLVIREPARAVDGKEKWLERVVAPTLSVAGKAFAPIRGLEKRVGLLFGHFDREHFDGQDLGRLLDIPGFSSVSIQEKGDDLIAVCRR